MAVVTVTRAGPDHLHIHIPYDHEGLRLLVKRIPGREWDKPARAWRVPATYDTLDTFTKLLPPGCSVMVHPMLRGQLLEQQQALVDGAQIKARGDADVDYPFRTQPYAHQRAGFAFLSRIGSGVLTWEMGTGKTKTAIDWCEWLEQETSDEFRVLVLCPNSVRYSVWAQEIPKHAGHSNFVVPEGTGRVRASKIGTAMYTIMNVESLSSGESAKVMSAMEWDVVIVDESTRFKTPNANRTKRLLKMKARYRLAMTGTPVPNSVADVWSQYTFVRPGLLGSFWAFKEGYLNKDFFGNVVGVRPERAQELQQRLDSVSYRVLKRDVLDLPEKVYTDRIVGLSEVQAKAYVQMQDELSMEVPDQSGDRVFAASVLTQLLRLTQVTAGMIGERGSYVWDKDNPKLMELDWLLNDELRSEQVVIFGLYQFELEQLAARYYNNWGAFRPSWHKGAGLTGPIIYGPTNAALRDEFITEFQDGRLRLLFCQVRTGGIGITLTRAKTAIYFTRSWSLEDYLQSQDRLHRIGQTGTVQILHLIAKGTVDEAIAKSLDRKQTTADLLTGDNLRALRRTLLEAKP